MNRLFCCVVLAALVAACSETKPAPPTPSSATTASTAAPAAKTKPPPRTRVGSTIAVTEAGDAVLVAEEDRRALWRVATPITTESKPQRVEMPGAPAQVLPLPDRLLVSIRDPGLLLIFDLSMKEIGRVELPADAWGLAITADGKTALVTSAWTHQLSAVDLASGQVRWRVDVAREPRGVVIPKEGDRAYVTHLVGTELTRVEGLSGKAPKLARIALPAAASRNPDPKQVSASLGYAAILSPDESRLFVARHALGALGDWFGAATIDVLGTATDEPLAPLRQPTYRPTAVTAFVQPDELDPLYAAQRAVDGVYGPIPDADAAPFVQPRAAVYRKATKTLLVASEGTDEIVELDARFLEPALMRRKRYRIGGDYPKAIVAARHGGAPSGIALSVDESKAYVFCRTTSDVAVVPLVPLDQHSNPLDTTLLRLAEEDPLLEGIAKTDPKRKFREAAVIGRRLFYNAIDTSVSGGMACSGCHPDGRDDGHVWHEVVLANPFGQDKNTVFLGGYPLLKQNHGDLKTDGPDFTPRTPEVGRARQTPMLAGRVRGEGVFGWQGESENLVARIEDGFRLHRWGLKWKQDSGAGGHAGAIASFLLSGLAEPPRPKAPLTDEQKRGKELFESDTTGCAACHIPEDKFSNWVAVNVKAPGRRAGFEDESKEAFKTPSLHHVGGTPPYYHDGSVPTLAALIANNADRMGKTSHLSKDDQEALVAYLETL